MARYNFAGKYGLKIPRVRMRGRVGEPIREDLGYQGLTELEKDRRYEPYGSKSRAYYERLKGADAERSRKFSLDTAKIQQKDEKEEFNKEKEFVGRWTDLVLKAREVGDITLQKHLISYGRDYIDTLSYQTRQLLEPILRAGPFDPAKAKLEKYDQYNPAPRITADPEREPLAHAQQTFDMEDWRMARTHFATGQSAPKRNLIPVSGKEGLYYMRDESGRVSQVSEETLQLKEFAKSFGVKEGEILQAGGYAGKSQTGNINGKVVNYRAFTSFPDGKTILEPLPGMTPEQFNKHEKEVAEFMAVLNTGDEKLIKKHPMAALVAKTEADGESFDTVAPLLKKAYGLNFVKPKEEATIMSHLWDIIKPGEHVKGNTLPFYGGYVEGDDRSIRAVPGEEMNLKGFRVFYDRDSDSVFSASDGIRLGGYEETSRKLDERFQLLDVRKKKREKEEGQKREDYLSFDVGTGT